MFLTLNKSLLRGINTAVEKQLNPGILKKLLKKHNDS